MATVTLTPDGTEHALPPDEVDDDGGDRTSIVPVSYQSFGRYRLCFEIASGGMGKVFLAHSEGPGGFEKFVAVKTIHAHLAERKDFVDMFLDEARLTSRIDHANVCSIIDFGKVADTYYIAMEYLSGETLSRVLTSTHRRADDEPHRVRYFARVIASACEGLHAAHELRDTKGRLLHVVHRDVSPHNIFLTYDGGVRVVDFGIARATDQLHQTTTGSVKGKWAYMSPEQARGKKIDRRADIWSLGVVLWEAITGRRLFRRANQTETVLAVVEERVAPPSLLKPSIPQEIDEIVMRALDRDVDKRWSSARAMGQALAHYLASLGQPVGMVELTEWMQEIFPGAAERKRELLASARDGRGLVAGKPDGSFPDQSEVRVTAAIGAEPLVNRSAEPPKRSRKPSLMTIAGKLGAKTPLLTAPDGLPTVIEPNPTPTSSQTDIIGRPARKRSGLGWWIASGFVGAAAVAVLAFVIADQNAGVGDTVLNAPEAPDVASGIAPDVATGLAIRAPDESSEEIAALPEPEPEAVPEPEAEPEPDPDSEANARDDPPRQSRASRRRARRRQLAAATTNAEPGRLSVVTTGSWADVIVDGRAVGDTPRTIELPPGPHVVELLPNGRRPAIRRTIIVEPDGRHRLSVAIEPSD